MLRVWHSLLDDLEPFLLRKEVREKTETVTVFKTVDPKVHIWAYGAIDNDVAKALGLTLVRALVVRSTIAGVAA